MNQDYFDKILAKAERGRTPQMIELGHSYLKGYDYFGKDFEKNFEKSRYWLDLAHKKGAFTATVLLGEIYEKGLGVDKDLDFSIELYNNAVERGAFLPNLYLARIYSDEHNSKYDVKLAMYWYQKVISFESQVDDSESIKEAKEYIKQKK